VFPHFKSTPQGSVTAWFTMRLTALGTDSEAAQGQDATSALAEYNARDTERVSEWNDKFFGSSHSKERLR